MKIKKNEIFDKQFHEAFVYKWVRLSTKEFYVGVHLGSPDDGYIGSGYVFRDKYNANPADWVRECVIPCDTYEDALELEELIVDEELVQNPACLNVRTGGRQGKPSEDTKKAISKAMLGKPKTEAHRKNMRKPKSREHARKAGAVHNVKVLCVETGIVYASITQACQALGMRTSSNITSVCKGRRKTAGGYTWRYVDED